MILRARQFSYQFPRPVLLMGIVNVTPDSFSDGGKFLKPDAAIEHALALVREGADIIDIGGESTRPNAAPVSEEEELRRVIPVIEALASRVAIPLSIDTMKPAVARAALRAGASIVNDVAANRDDDTMWRVIAEAQAGYIAMHMQGTPQTMQQAPTYQNVCEEVGAFFGERLQQFARAGLPEESVVLDVGIGFGKSVAHNLQLLAGLRGFTRWHRPLLLGVSRKSFLPKATGDNESADRLPGSLACACWGAANGMNILRTHDVTASRQALRMTEAISAAANTPETERRI